VSRSEARTVEQERALVVAAGDGDADACRELVDTFMPAIGSLAVAYSAGAGVERQELLQQGVVGLLLAARRYDPSRSTPFWAYGSFWVRKAMQELVADLTRPTALSDRAVRAVARMRSVRRDYVQSHGADPTIAQLSTATGFTETHLESLQTTERVPHALEEALEGEASGTFGDTIADPSAEQAYDSVLDRIEVDEVRDLLDRLDARERVVVRAHFGFGQPAQTLDQIGVTLGLTAERARQIEARALTKMRDVLARSVLPV
jgi:RNA polymerase sigma factor (sigma-70 family)